MDKIAFTGYLYCSKEDVINQIEKVLIKEDLYVSDKILSIAKYWGSEVSVQCELNITTGEVEIVGCEGFLIDRTKKLIEVD